MCLLPKGTNRWLDSMRNTNRSFLLLPSPPPLSPVSYIHTHEFRSHARPQLQTDNIDTIEKRIRGLFSRCAHGELQGVQADDEYNEISKDYYKILEDADEKVQLANLMYDLVDRYLRRLDSELYKFKCELEADHNGITEILEKRSLELEGNSSSNSSSLNCNSILNNSTSNAGNSQKENRFFGSISVVSCIRLFGAAFGSRRSPCGMCTLITHFVLISRQNRDKYKSRPEKRRNSSSSTGPTEKRPALSTPGANVVNTPNNVSSVHPSNASLVLPTKVRRSPWHVCAPRSLHSHASHRHVALATHAHANCFFFFFFFLCGGCCLCICSILRLEAL